MPYLCQSELQQSCYQMNGITNENISTSAHETFLEKPSSAGRIESQNI